MSTDRNGTTDLFDIFGRNLDKAENGVWVNAPRGDLRCLIARSGNPHHKEVSRRLLAPYQDQVDRGTLSDEDNERITIRAMAESLLLDWENMTLSNDKGEKKAVKYTREAAIKVLSDPVFEDFKNWVAVQASNQELFRIRAMDAAAKN